MYFECTLKDMSRQSIQKIKAMLFCIEYGIFFVDTVNTKIKASNALNAKFVETVDTTVKTHPHIPANNFLSIQLIFNLKKVLESWGWWLFNHTINTIYVDTVDTRQGSLYKAASSDWWTAKPARRKTFQIAFPLGRGERWEATSYRVEYSFHTSLLFIRCCIEATNTSINSVNKHSIQCIACFDLHVDSVDKKT